MGSAGSKPLLGVSWCELFGWPEGPGSARPPARPALPRGLQPPRLSSHQWPLQPEMLETFTVTRCVRFSWTGLSLGVPCGPLGQGSLDARDCGVRAQRTGQ